MTTFNTMDRERIRYVKDKMTSSILSLINDPVIPNKISNLLEMHCVVSGGMSASTFYGEEPNDYDLYFTSYSAMDDFKTMMDTKTIRTIIKDINPAYQDTTPIVSGKCVTAHAFTLINDLQIIVMDTCKSVEFFDFVHCQPYYNIAERTYYISKRQYDSIIHKELVPTGTCELSDKRIAKFKNRGWKFDDSHQVSV